MLKTFRKNKSRSYVNSTVKLFFDFCSFDFRFSVLLFDISDHHSRKRTKTMSTSAADTAANDMAKHMMMPSMTMSSEYAKAMVQNTLINALTKRGINNVSQYILLYCSDEIKKLTTFLVDTLIEKLKYVMATHPSKYLSVLFVSFPLLVFRLLKTILTVGGKLKLSKNAKDTTVVCNVPAAKVHEYRFFIQRKNADRSYNLYFNALIRYVLSEGCWKALSDKCSLERLNRDVENELFDIRPVTITSIKDVKAVMAFEGSAIAVSDNADTSKWIMDYIDSHRFTFGATVTTSPTTTYHGVLQAFASACSNYEKFPEVLNTIISDFELLKASPTAKVAQLQSSKYTYYIYEGTMKTFGDYCDTLCLVENQTFRVKNSLSSFYSGKHEFTPENTIKSILQWLTTFRDDYDTYTKSKDLLPQNVSTVDRIVLNCFSTVHQPTAIHKLVKEYVARIYQDYHLNSMVQQPGQTKKKDVSVFMLKMKRTMVEVGSSEGKSPIASPVMSSPTQNGDDSKDNDGYEKNNNGNDDNDNDEDAESDDIEENVNVNPKKQQKSQQQTQQQQQQQQRGKKRRNGGGKQTQSSSPFSHMLMQPGMDFDMDLMFPPQQHHSHRRYPLHHFVPQPPPPPKMIEKAEPVCEKQGTIYKDVNNLFLREKASKRLRSILKNFRDNKDIYVRMDITHKMGLLLYGEPGTGKTTTVKAVASFLGMDLYFVDLRDVKTNVELTNLIKLANGNSQLGCVIVFEDIDAMTDIVLKRSTDVSNGNSEIPAARVDDATQLTLSGLLNVMDGLNSMDEIVFILSTNHPDKLDPALIRRGRIDAMLEFKFCDRPMFAEIFRTIMGKELEDHVLSRLIEDRFTPADAIFTILPFTYNSVASDEEIMAEFIGACAP